MNLKFPAIYQEQSQKKPNKTLFMTYRKTLVTWRVQIHQHKGKLNQITNKVLLVLIKHKLTFKKQTKII